jgi:hypothetical protein
MARSTGYSLPAIAVSTVALLAIVLALLIFLPLPDWRGAEKLSQISIDPGHWNQVPLRSAVADMNAAILKKGETRYRLFVPEEVDPNNERTISMAIDGEMPVTEYARYVSEISGMRYYSTPKGIVIDYLHRDHRSWRRKFRDWVMYDLFSHWNGRMYEG